MTSSNERKGAAERAVRLRLKWVAAYREVRDAGAVCRRFGISRPTLRKWLRRFDAQGEAGLEELSRRPRTSPARKVGPVEEDRILNLAPRAAARRETDSGRAPAPARRAAVPFGDPQGPNDLGALPPRKRVRHKPKRYSRPVPGERVQMDVCKIRPGLYQFTAIDDCSRYLVAGLARRPSAAATLAFLDQVLDEMPFPIQRIQTDRGAEFFAEAVQRRLMAETIKFRPIPPRSPHLNGKVERAQRTVLEEFWATVDARAPDVGGQLAVWVHHYNWDRQHEALNGSTPIDRVCERASKTPLHGEVSDVYEPAKERIQVREHSVDLALRSLKPCL